MKKLLLFTITLFTTQFINAQIWAQLGIDIDGENTYDQFGSSTSISNDGSTIAAGAIYNDGNGSESGHVRVYKWNGSVWLQKGTDIDGQSAGSNFGTSVSLSSDGNIIAIGADYSWSGGLGRVSIYQWNGFVWLQKGTDINGEAVSDLFGNSVSINDDGTIVAIGAPQNDGNGTDAGHVRIYNWNGSAWIQRGNDIDGEAAGDLSGGALSLSADGNTLVIGAENNDGNGNNSGHVRVYSWNGNSWLQKGPDINGESGNDLSGTSVSINANGDLIAIGAPQNINNGITAAGHVRVYSWNGNTWTKQGLDIDGTSINGYSGSAISLSATGNIVAIGSPSVNSSKGRVKLYEWNPTTWSWPQKGQDIDGERFFDRYGCSVSLSYNGDTLATGALKNDYTGGGKEYGHVRIHHFPTSVGINSFDKSTVKIYPNPTNGIITVNTDNIITDEITITDIVGKIILLQKPQNTSPTIDLSEYNSGIYFVKIKMNNELQTIKIIKQ